MTRTRWAALGVVYLGVAAVSAATSAWAGFVAALLIAALMFVLAKVAGPTRPDGAGARSGS